MNHKHGMENLQVDSQCSLQFKGSNSNSFSNMGFHKAENLKIPLGRL